MRALLLLLLGTSVQAILLHLTHNNWLSQEVMYRGGLLIPIRRKALIFGAYLFLFQAILDNFFLMHCATVLVVGDEGCQMELVEWKSRLWV